MRTGPFSKKEPAADGAPCWANAFFAAAIAVAAAPVFSSLRLNRSTMASSCGADSIPDGLFVVVVGGWWLVVGVTGCSPRRSRSDRHEGHEELLEESVLPESA